MDRRAWLAERRSAVLAAYDAEAPAYDEQEYPSDLHRAARPGGVMYLTVEKVEQAEIDRAFQSLSARVLTAPCRHGQRPVRRLTGPSP